MTIIGIVLSVAMFTAVTEAVASMRDYLIKGVCQQEGSYHALTQDINGETLQKLRAEQDVKQTETLGGVGYADIGSHNSNKPYLYIASMSDNFTDLAAVQLDSGRMPKNSGEILLPLHLYSNGGVSYEIGDTLDLTVGRRMSDGTLLSQGNSFKDGEQLVGELEKTYTVVGFYNRFSTSVEPYSSPGYTALTVGERADVYTAFFTLKRAGSTYDFINDWEYGKILANTSLMMLYGVSRHATAMRVLIGMAAILIGLIMFGSVALIYNSFSISVGERTKQFGILKSIGATKKQIRRTVFYEALFLCVIGVPLGIFAGCAGLGITFYLLRGAFGSAGSYFNIGNGIVLKLVISPAALLTAAVIGVVTTVISAYIPARRAVKVSAIDAVRRTNDITGKAVKIRSSKLIYRLFGFEGMIAAKNFRRNKKRYRTAVFSLFVSVVLFISASSFCRYLTDSASAVDTTLDYDIRYDINNADDGASERIYSALSSADGVTDSVMCSQTVDSYLIDWNYISDYAVKLYYNGIENAKSKSDYDIISPSVCYVDDSEYERIAKENKLEVDMSNPGALVYDFGTEYVENKDGDYVVHTFNYFDKNKISDSFVLYRANNVDEHSFYKVSGGTAYYIPDERGENEDLPVTEDDMLKVDKSKALSEKTYGIAGFLRERPFFITADLAFIYPRSAMSEPLSDGSAYMLFVSSDHKLSYSKMTKLLNDMNADKSGLYDYAESVEGDRALVTIINVFAYGFIILISLIALTNVFNTVSTNIFLRRRELAMMKSVGMTKKGFNKMMNYECIICGVRGLALGLPVSVLVTFLIYTVVTNGYAAQFYMPWYSIAISVFSVFAVVFIAMLYSMSKIRRENTIDILRNENI